MTFLDEIDDNDNISKIDEENYRAHCEFCQKKANYNIGDNFDICEKCLDDWSTSLLKFNIIDRLSYSIIDKSLIWKCCGKNCDKIMGGGHKWYNINEFDLCENCAINKNLKVDIDNKRSNYIVSRSCNNVPIIVEPLQLNEYDTYGETIYNNDYLDLINSLAYSNIDDSILAYTLITPITEMNTFNASTGLIMNCRKNSQHDVASICVDDHGRVGFNKLYDSYDEYKNEYSKWLSHMSEGECENDIMANASPMSEGECENDIMAKASHVFSEYIRLIKDFDFYYG